MPVVGRKRAFSTKLLPIPIGVSIGPAAPPIQVQLIANSHSRAYLHRRFPNQTIAGLTILGTGGVGEYGFNGTPRVLFRMLGPHPPVSILRFPTQRQQTVAVAVARAAHAARRFGRRRSEAYSLLIQLPLQAPIPPTLTANQLIPPITTMSSAVA